jgi:dTDP-4-dehydrorhamnose reductase
MRSFVVGASGYIGKHLLTASAAPKTGTSSKESPALLRLRLEFPDEFDYEIVQPADVFFLTAAISAPDVCAHEHARAWAVNVTGTSIFITKVIARGGRVVFFSSDTVYGERNDEFDERAACNPAGEYAQMKREIESHFLGNSLFKAIRLSYVFSKEDKFTKYLAGCAARSDDAEIFHPFYRAVIHRDDIVQGAIALAQRWDDFPHAAINFGGPAVLSRTEFAETLRETALPTLRFRVTEPDAEFFRNRPRVISMKSPILAKLLGRPALTLRESIMIEFNSK